MTRLVDDILKFLHGEPPRTFMEIFDAIDFDGTRGELRSCLESLRSSAKLLTGRCADGFTRYSLTKFERVPIAATPRKSPAPSQPEAQSTDVAGAAVAVSEIPARTIAQRVHELIAGNGRKWSSVSALAEQSDGALSPRQVTQGLQRMRLACLVEMKGDRAGARWRAVSSPGPQGSTENACTAAGAVAVSPEPLSSMAPAPADPPQAALASSKTLSPLPLRLLARIESVAVDIEELTGEALDAGLGTGAIKSLVTAGGALRRALLPFNIRN